jgi:hypothetical protein
VRGTRVRVAGGSCGLGLPRGVYGLLWGELPTLLYVYYEASRGAGRERLRRGRTS